MIKVTKYKNFEELKASSKSVTKVTPEILKRYKEISEFWAYLNKANSNQKKKLRVNNTA